MPEKHDLFRVHNLQGRIEVTGRRERRCNQLLDDLKEKRGVLGIERGSTGPHCVWRDRYRKGYVLVVRQTTQ
jgi:Cys-tRNA synthase (O-phospho-L-seryl-tRNA:Cys-tRNA synthase)